MTYEESYMKCETLDDLKQAIAEDLKTASWLNPDRCKPISNAGVKVAELKFGHLIPIVSEIKEV